MDRKDIVGDVGRVYMRARSQWLKMNEIFQIESRDVLFLETVFNAASLLVIIVLLLCI